MQKGRFPAAGGPDERDEVPPVERESDAGDRMDFCIAARVSAADVFC
jgi:hypothetical protein